MTAIGFSEFARRMRSEPVYVILGVQGSGTNLLRSIIDPAFNFSVVQDQALVYNAAARLGATTTPEAVRREFEAMRPRLLPTPLSRKTLRRVKTNGSFEGIDAAFDPSTIRSGTDFAYLVYAYSAFSRNSDLMAIKSDDLWETIDKIDEVLPNRRIILLTRDFRDNLLSITNKDFGPVEPLMAARYVKERFAHYHHEFQRTPEANRLHVRYEDLLENPDGFVARFRSHFRVGSGGGAVPPVNTSRIRRGNTKKWAALSSAQLAQVEAILRSELVRYGYQPECEPAALPSAFDIARAKTLDSAKRVPQKLRSLAKRLRR